MNICMLLDNEFTGDMRVENEVMSLTEMGHRVTVLCLNFGSSKQREEYHGATIIRFPVNRKTHKRRRGWTGNSPDFFVRWWCRKAGDYLMNHPTDAIHAHDLYMLPVAMKLKKDLNLDIKLVADLHENYPAALENYSFTNRFPGNLLVRIDRWRENEKKWLQDADTVITVIEEALDRYSNLGVSRDRLHLVPNYVSPENFLRESKAGQPHIDLPERHYHACYIGGFDLHRGLETLFQALTIVKKVVPKYRLLLVGSGPNQDKLINLQHELGLDENIYFAGWQPSHTLAGFIEKSDACLVPHLKTEHTDHTIPHKLFHYMLLKKPVIVSNCAPLQRIVENAECGFVFESENSEDAAEKLLAMAQMTSAERDRFGMHGHRAVQKKYHWGVSEEGLREIYGIASTNESDESVESDESGISQSGIP